MRLPAKTFELLALGLELRVFCEHSDTARRLNGLDGVCCVQSGDEPALRAMLHDVCHRHVNEGTLRAPAQRALWKYARSAQNERFAAVIDNVPCAPNCPKGRCRVTATTLEPC
jgi:hypothetical protein